MQSFEDCPHHDSRILEAICHRSRQLKNLMPYIDKHWPWDRFVKQNKSKSKTISNVTAEAMKVILKLRWEFCKWLLRQQCYAAVISVLNAFAETLLEVKEKNKIFWEMQKWLFSTIAISLLFWVKVHKKKKKEEEESPPELFCWDWQNLFHSGVLSRLSYKWLVCRDRPQPAEKCHKCCADN